MSGRDSGDWVKDRYASNLYRSAFLSNRLQTSLLMARTVAVMASRAANISTEERRTFDRFEAPTRKEPSPGTFAFGSIYSETMRAFHPPPQACMLPMSMAGKAAGIRICFTLRPPFNPYAFLASLISFGTLLIDS